MIKIFSILVIIAAIISFSFNKIDKNNDLKQLKIKEKAKYIVEREYFSYEDKEDDTNKYQVSYRLYTFNNDGNFVYCIDNIFYDYNSRFNFKYNDKGTIDQMIEYDSDGNPLNKNTYKYDEYGNIIQLLITNINDSLSEKYIYKYDDKGNIVELIGYDSDSSILFTFLHKYKFNNNGKVIQSTTNSYDDGYTVISTSIFNDKEYEIETIDNFGNNNYIYTFKYEYNKYGDWIIKHKYKNNKYASTIERKIVYYGDEDENNYPEWDSSSYMGELTPVDTETYEERY